MAQLVFLTGAPGSGKSTLARLLVDARSLALLLDLDTLRAQLGDWKADPDAAGIRARLLALAAARAQLELGGDVVVPQFLRRPRADRAVPRARGSGGGVVRPRCPRQQLRRRPPSASVPAGPRRIPNHRDAAHLQDAPGAAPVEELYADMLAMLAGFPEAVYVESVPGDIAGDARPPLREVLRR